MLFRSSVSSTGEWCLAARYSPRARKAEHTAKASGTDAFQITRDSHQTDHKMTMRHLKPVGRTRFTFYPRPEKYTSSEVTLNIKLPTWSSNPTVRTNTSTTWSYTRRSPMSRVAGVSVDILGIATVRRVIWWVIGRIGCEICGSSPNGE